MRDVTLAILAGGAGSRMGRAKADLLLNGRPILQYLLERLKWAGPTLLVTAPGREHPPAASFFTREVPDPVAGQGPLRGILTALESADTQRVLVVTVDMPGIQRSTLTWLVEALPPTASGLLMRDGSRVEPFPSVYYRSAADLLRRRLEQGHSSVHRLLDDRRFACLPAPGDWPASTWVNLNCPDDVEAFAGNTMPRGE